MRPLLYIIALTLLCVSCEKGNVNAGKKVEIYLLKNYQVTPGKCKIDSSLAILQDSPVIENQDILKYSKVEYQFTLTSTAIQKVKDFGDNTPFAVTVDKKVIYYGVFKPGFSSSSCNNSITMDVAWTPGNKIFMNLGYPGPQTGVPIDDQRNNPDLIAALKNQGKLN